MAYAITVCAPAGAQKKYNYAFGHTCVKEAQQTGAFTPGVSGGLTAKRQTTRTDNS
jgi:hypothetical protein